jgi:hypothetical protein
MLGQEFPEYLCILLEHVRNRKMVRAFLHTLAAIGTLFDRGHGLDTGYGDSVRKLLQKAKAPIRPVQEPSAQGFHGDKAHAPFAGNGKRPLLRIVFDVFT